MNWRNWIVAFAVLLGSSSLFPGSAAAQNTGVNWTNPSNAASLTLTITPTGGGTGSISDSTMQIVCGWTGSATTGTCTGSYSLGQPVTLTVAITGSSTFSWGGSIPIGSTPCSGSGTCGPFSVTQNSSIGAVFTALSGAGLPGYYFCVDWNGTTLPNATNPLSYGCGRIWDLSAAQWPSVETAPCSVLPCLGGANNVFNFATVDSVLAQQFAAGALRTDWVLSRQPFYTTGQAGTSCTVFNSSTCGDYTCNNTTACAKSGDACGGAGNNAPGQCDPPTDKNHNGTGTNLQWRNWVAAASAHANGIDDANCPSGPTCYTKTHAPVTEWELHNEPDNNPFYRMNTVQNVAGTETFGGQTFDGLARDQFDAYFIIKGDANFIFTVTSVNGSGVYTGTWPSGSPANTYNNYFAAQHFTCTGYTGGASGNNLTNVVATASTSTTLTLTGSTTSSSSSATCRMVNPYTGETALTVQNAQIATALRGFGPTGASSVLLTPSFHPPSGVVAYMQAFLYCTGPQVTGSNCTGPGAWPVSDGINEHAKVGGGYAGSSTWLKNTLDLWQTNINGVLQPAEQAKPLYGTEGGFASCGWCTSGSATNPIGPYASTSSFALNQGSYIPKFYVYSLVKGYSIVTWYDWHNNSIGSSNAAAAFSMTSNVMTGMTGLSCSWIANGTGDATQPSLAKCPFTQTGGVPSLWIWDDDNTGATATGTFWDTGAANNLECDSSVCPTHNQTVTTSWNQISYLDDTGTKHTGCGSTTCTYAVGIQPLVIQNQ